LKGRGLGDAILGIKSISVNVKKHAGRKRNKRGGRKRKNSGGRKTRERGEHKHLNYYSIKKEIIIYLFTTFFSKVEKVQRGFEPRLLDSKSNVITNYTTGPKYPVRDLNPRPHA
jgi:hypothetical protein